VLNEGVDVPEASVAILLSGTGSAREYIQRLGRVLRKGKAQKFALLYEVVAEETTEEGVSRRRRQVPKPKQGHQLELMSSFYETPTHKTHRAAEAAPVWRENGSEEED
jgi:superfamily II DNA or RNA helicase